MNATQIQSPFAAAAEQAVRVSPISEQDAAEGARILFEAFHDLYDYHRFPGAYPTPEFAARVIEGLIAHPAIWGVAAHSDGELLGTSFLDERGLVKAVGPVSVDPRAQTRGVGRSLTRAVLDRAGAGADVRLLQDAFNRMSLALYVSMGFEVREALVLLAGQLRGAFRSAHEVRPLENEDVEQCERLCVDVHGFDRTRELRDATGDAMCSPIVAIREGAIVAYATTLNYFPAAYAVGRNEHDLQGLIAGAAALARKPLSFLLPTHQGALLRWCLEEGMRVIKPMTYMTTSAYSRPRGGWLPSVMY